MSAGGPILSAPLWETFHGRWGIVTDAYAAWGWAVNGFFSVIGAVLTTILSMTFGFRAVQLAALAIYAVAVLAFLALRRSAARPPGEPGESDAAVARRNGETPAGALTAAGSPSASPT